MGTRRRKLQIEDMGWGIPQSDMSDRTGIGIGKKGMVAMDWKKWAADRGLQKWFRRDNFLILILTGILLVIIALPTKEGGKEEGAVPDSGAGGQASVSQGQEGDRGTAPAAQGNAGNGPVPQGTDGEEEYAAYLEKRLTDALSQMADVGRVRVMITLKASRELVVEKY